jgi:hypothetical protein
VVNAERDPGQDEDANAAQQSTVHVNLPGKITEA